MECRSDLAAASLAAHMKTQHRRSGCAETVTKPAQLNVPPVEYQVVLPWTAPSINCPYEGCPGRYTNLPNLWMHCIHRNVEYIIVISNEVTGPHPQCYQCDKLIPWEALIEVNLGPAIVKRGAEWKSHRLAAATIQETAATEFRAWEHVIGCLKMFKYLGQILLFDNSDYPAVDGNLWKARWICGRFYYMIIWYESDTWTSGRFYIAVVQCVLMFRTNTWVIKTCILRSMGSIHNWAAHLIFIRMSHQLWNRVRNYLPIGISMEDAGM